MLACCPVLASSADPVLVMRLFGTFLFSSKRASFFELPKQHEAIEGPHSESHDRDDYKLGP